MDQTNVSVVNDGVETIWSSEDNEYGIKKDMKASKCRNIENLAPATQFPIDANYKVRETRLPLLTMRVSRKKSSMNPLAPGCVFNNTKSSM
ncbi:unnamed protein product [Caenorhabditis brenneri]